MIHKLQSVKAEENLIISAVFFDGTVKKYDVKQLFEVYPQLKELENSTLFDNVKVDTGGYGVSWNDSLDLEAETIWENGILVERSKPSPMLEIATRMAYARAIAGITQKQLAERTGIYQSEISKIERGIGNPSVDTLQRLAEGMDMIIDIQFVKKEK